MVPPCSWLLVARHLLASLCLYLDLIPLSSPFFEDPEQEDEIQLKEGDIVVVYERDESGQGFFHSVNKRRSCVRSSHLLSLFIDE